MERARSAQPVRVIFAISAALGARQLEVRAILGRLAVELLAEFPVEPHAEVRRGI